MATVASGITTFSHDSETSAADSLAYRASNLATLLSLLGDQLFSLPGVDGGAIHLLNAGADALVTAHLEMPDEFKGIKSSYQGFQYPLSNADINVQVFNAGAPMRIEAGDLHRFAASTRLRFERMKMTSLLVMPLLLQHGDLPPQKLGVISLFSQTGVLEPRLAQQAAALALPYAPLIQVHWRLHQALERSASVEAMYARIQQFVAGITEMNSRTELSEVFALIGKEFIECFRFDLVNIVLHQNNELVAVHSEFGERFRHLAPRWNAFASVTRYSLDASDGQAAFVFLNNKPLLLHDAMQILHLPMSESDRSGLALLETTRTFLLMPIRLRGQPIGVMALATLDEPIALPESEMMLIEMLASFISTAIRNAQAHAQVEQQKREIELLNLDLRSKVLLLDEIARKDRLTGLNNFGNFEEELKRRISERERVKEFGALSMILFDVDSFKQFNDTYGHPAGNQVLQEVATRILKCSREMDFVARYGGEEFAVLLPQCDLDHAYVIAERMRHAIAEQSFVIDGREHAVSISGGCAQLRPQENSRDFICRADEALYAAKHNGRNRIEKSA